MNISEKWREELQYQLPLEFDRYTCGKVLVEDKTTWADKLKTKRLFPHEIVSPLRAIRCGKFELGSAVYQQGDTFKSTSELSGSSGVEDASLGRHATPVGHDLNVTSLRPGAEAHPLTVLLRTTWIICCEAA
jgi:hypothetical protein